MCMRRNQVRPHQRWSWAGDEIVHDPIIRAERRIPGTKKKHYEIDIRQFLSSEGNAVLGKLCQEIAGDCSPEERALLRSSRPGSFDFRKVRTLHHFEKLRYLPVRDRFVRRRRGREFEPWLFPEETYALGGGDCEDLAFLLTALLESMGISPYCLRVALGMVIDHSAPGKPRSWDHAWAVYKNEGGAWEILEPLAFCMDARGRRSVRQVPKTVRALMLSARRSRDIEYVPYYVFNRQHLWRVRSPHPAAAQEVREYLRERDFWKGFDPGFALGIHNDILDEALYDMTWYQRELVKEAGFWADVNVLAYDPRDHVDFAYTDEGWSRMRSRLQTGDIRDFGLAVHSIADFYAHTLYAEFAPRTSSGAIRLYDPSFDASGIAYDFAQYKLPGCGNDRAYAEQRWGGELISGQWWRWYTTFPDELQDAPGFGDRRCLPDHDVLAVDGPNWPGDEHRYEQEMYEDQYALRRTAATRHIRDVWRDWR